MHSEFETACLNAFRDLVERFGFDEPEVESIGRETYVRYHKGRRTVSIAYEDGTEPIVELFYPSCETGDKPVPWAARGDVPYSRRIPRLKVDASSDGGSVSGLQRYLAASLLALESVERSFLERPSA